jgi:2-polyprenyl-6-methoxyphenol hydroxylase-like FAD-dependent oxidoreductase
MVRQDIAVVGCGTAGLAAALLLVRDDHRVTLFERFEAPEPIGSGLMLQRPAWQCSVHWDWTPPS